MRVVLLHCGARRAKVRVQALEFLALILRLTWNSYGSFFRVRVPLLAVQSEVMDRIVTTATRRYYREQRRRRMDHDNPNNPNNRNQPIEIEYLSSEGAEASLATLWRTLDRLQHNSVSQNVAFRTAQMRLAETMKTLFRAYIGANALAIANRQRLKSSLIIKNDHHHHHPHNNNSNNNNSSMYQANRIMNATTVTTNNTTNTTNTNASSSTSSAVIKSNWNSHNHVRLRNIISKSACSRQFVGLFSEKEGAIFNEAVEDAFRAAADVFSSTGTLY